MTGIVGLIWLTGAAVVGLVSGLVVIAAEEVNIFCAVSTVGPRERAGLDLTSRAGLIRRRRRGNMRRRSGRPR